MGQIRILLATSIALAATSFAVAAKIPAWRPVPLPAAVRQSLERCQNGAYIISSDDWYVWGPSVIRTKDGQYHMFYSRWPKRIGFQAWLAMSEIVHAVADRPEGPYRFVAVVMPSQSPGRGEWFSAYNPKIKQFNGKFYLYFVQTRGNIDNAGREEMSRVGYKHPRWMEVRNNQRTFVAVADSLDGPWRVSPRPIVQPAKTITRITVNPAVCRGPNGTYFMIVKGDKPGETRFIRNQAVATAPAPDGPWTIQPKPAIDYLDTEDVSMWYDRRWKRFFAVFHAHTFIGMITSDDGYDWRKAEQFEITPRLVSFDDSRTWAPDRMERPFVLTDATGRPQMLFVACKKADQSVILAIPLRKGDR